MESMERRYFENGMLSSECDSEEDFLDKTFKYISGKLAYSLSGKNEYDPEYFYEFFRTQYNKIMEQENAGEEFFNYEELLKYSEGSGRNERICWNWQTCPRI